MAKAVNRELLKDVRPRDPTPKPVTGATRAPRQRRLAVLYYISPCAPPPRAWRPPLSARRRATTTSANHFLPGRQKALEFARHIPKPGLPASRAEAGPRADEMLAGLGIRGARARRLCLRAASVRRAPFFLTEVRIASSPEIATDPLYDEIEALEREHREAKLKVQALVRGR